MRFVIGIFFVCYFFTCIFAKENEALLAEIETFLNHFSKAKIALNQVNADGDNVQGILFLDRKNKKLRIDYPQTKQYMLARVGFLYFVDEKERTIDYVDASYTPIGFFFKENIKFNENVYVNDMCIDKNDIFITISEHKHNEKGGAVTLHFRKNKNISFKGWIVEDMQGNTTRVQINDIDKEASFDQKIFDKPELKDLKDAEK